MISPMQGYGAVKRNGSSSKRRSAASERRDSGGAQVMVLKESQASPAVSAPSQGDPRPATLLGALYGFSRRQGNFPGEPAPFCSRECPA